jgi:hypothetical protein
MNYDDADVLDVVTALDGSLGEVNMSATVDQIVAAGRRRRRRRRAAGVVAGLVAITGIGLTVNHGGTGTAPLAGSVPAAGSAPAGAVHVHTVSFTVDSQSDGTVQVTWDKQRYFDDHDGLQAALTKAGMPVTIRVGEFCAGPNDDTTLNPSGVGPGVDRVMKGVSPNGANRSDKVAFVFTPSAMPAGKQLFIGYLNAAQLAVTHGAPGSVERLVSTGVPLVCTTTPPPTHS